MKWTVLGCQSPYPGPGGGTPGYLLEVSGQRILVDCGSGVLSKLGCYFQPHQLDAVWLSHLHFDHIADFFVLQYAVKTEVRLGRRKAPLTVYAPAEPADWAEKLNKYPYVLHQSIHEGQTYPFHGCEITAHRTEHAIPCYALKIQGQEKVILYGADAGPSTPWNSMCIQPDLFVCEGTFLHQDLPLQPVGHHSVLQAAMAAQRIKAHRLLLTHLYPGYSHQSLWNEASSAYSGQLSIASPGWSISL
ncbi:MBL fold metallo-hydrolase [Melghirimyces algeriensis]|uniref:Ribonuclease BN, tRNA processing enzyme n=1 Tax=Melghirimyces algeriensis TaxID=910412 RepID=A0A521C963_9BACL|nr:MBL fold metallo-hydrolase [Melghirimyces algeriensis]SMO55938.1 Ribonuclease BN, tRNA processing enzyme [Melghirimyces algeriensis]